MPRNVVLNAAASRMASSASRRQVEHAVAGVPGLRVATYPSGRRTYIYRYRDPITGRKTAITLGTAD